MVVPVTLTNRSWNDLGFSAKFTLLLCMNWDISMDTIFNDGSPKQISDFLWRHTNMVHFNILNRFTLAQYQASTLTGTQTHSIRTPSQSEDKLP